MLLNEHCVKAQCKIVQSVDLGLVKESLLKIIGDSLSYSHFVVDLWRGPYIKFVLSWPTAALLQQAALPQGLLKLKKIDRSIHVTVG